MTEAARRSPGGSQGAPLIALGRGEARRRVALVGNPNTGKTTLFNALTGLRQRVANYPGVTVELKLGSTLLQDAWVELLDLPGLYSLAAHSPDEVLALDALLGRVPDLPAPDLIVARVSKQDVLTRATDLSLTRSGRRSSGTSSALCGSC